MNFNKIPALILCGGRGTRMGSISKNTPKSLILIQDKPIIWYIILLLYMNGFRKFILPLGYKGEYIRDYINNNLSNIKDIKIVFIETGCDTEISKRIKIVLEKCVFDDEILLLNGDAVFDINFSDIYEKHIGSGFMASLISVEIASQWGLIIESREKVVNFVRDEKVKYFSVGDSSIGYIYSGIAFIKVNSLRNINHEVTRDFESSLYPSLIKSGNLGNIKTNEFWFSIDTQKDMNTINQLENQFGSNLKKIKENIINHFNSVTKVL